MADDTDVYILLLHYYNQKELKIPMFNGRQTIDIRATAKEHANILPTPFSSPWAIRLWYSSTMLWYWENENT